METGDIKTFSTSLTGRARYLADSFLHKSSNREIGFSAAERNCRSLSHDCFQKTKAVHLSPFCRKVTFSREDMMVDLKVLWNSRKRGRERKREKDLSAYAVFLFVCKCIKKSILFISNHKFSQRIKRKNIISGELRWGRQNEISYMYYHMREAKRILNRQLTFLNLGFIKKFLYALIQISMEEKY